MTDDSARRPGSFLWTSKTALINSTIKSWEQNVAQNRPAFKSESSRRVLSNPDDAWTADQRWTDVVAKHVQDNMDERQKGQQEAIWELIHTEKRYIEQLKTLRDFWLAALQDAQRRHDFVITDGDVEKIFGHLPDVYTVQEHLWNRCFGTVLAHAKSTGLPLNPGLLENGFANMKKSFAPYLEYCSQYHNSDKHLKHLINDKNSPHLDRILKWCKNQPQSERLPLGSWLIQPVQRIMRYSILLSAILKKTDDEYHQTMLSRLVTKVDKFVKTINDKTRETQEQEKLDAVCDRINMYDIFVSPTDEISEVLKGYVSKRFLNSPPEHGFRRLFLRELKNVIVEDLDETGKSIGDHMLLFSDIMLVCRLIKINGNRRLNITRPVIHLSRLHVHPLRKPGSCLLIIADPSLRIAQDGFIVSPTGKLNAVYNFVNDAEKAKAAAIAGMTVLLDAVSNTVIAGSTSDDFLDDDGIEEPSVAENLGLPNKNLVTATDKKSDPNLLFISDNQNPPSPNPGEMEGSARDTPFVTDIQNTSDTEEQENKPPCSKLLKRRDSSSPDSSGNVSRSDSMSTRPDENDRPPSQNSSSGVETLSDPTTPASASPTPEAEDVSDFIQIPETPPLPSPSPNSVETKRQTFLTDAIVFTMVFVTTYAALVILRCTCTW